MTATERITAKLRAARESRGWSQAKVAEELGVSRRAVEFWEAGTKMPRLDTFNRWCSLLGVVFT